MNHSIKEFLKSESEFEELFDNPPEITHYKRSPGLDIIPDSQEEDERLQTPGHSIRGYDEYKFDESRASQAR